MTKLGKKIVNGNALVRWSINLSTLACLGETSLFWQGTPYGRDKSLPTVPFQISNVNSQLF